MVNFKMFLLYVCKDKNKTMTEPPIITNSVLIITKSAEYNDMKSVSRGGQVGDVGKMIENLQYSEEMITFVLLNCCRCYISCSHRCP